jgi:hypothetical protein
MRFAGSNTDFAHHEAGTHLGIEGSIVRKAKANSRKQGKSVSEFFEEVVEQATSARKPARNAWSESGAERWALRTPMPRAMTAWAGWSAWHARKAHAPGRSGRDAGLDQP